MELTNLEPMEREEAAEASFPSSTNAEPAGEWRTTAKYTSSLERCATCEYFQQEGMCAKYKSEVEEGGHCQSWEPLDEGGASEEASEEEGDDMEELDQLA